MDQSGSHDPVQVTGHATRSSHRALRLLRRRVHKNPNDVKSLVLLGAFLFEPFHETEESIKTLRRVLELDESNVDARFWLAKCLFHDIADPREAKRLLDEALQIDPCRAECLSLLASAIADLGGAPAEYVGLLQKAAELAPDWVSTHEHLAWVLLEMGRVEEAEKEARVAQSLLRTAPVTKCSLEELEDYFETAVTGRGLHEINEELIRRIEHERIRRNLNSQAPSNVEKEKEN